MPFRRLRRRHTVNGPPGSAALASPSRSGGSITDPSYKDPVAEMQKRKEDEEAKARQMMTSDLLSFCVHLLQSLLSLIIALIYYNHSDESDQQEEEVEAEESTEEKSEIVKKRYQKVVVANNVVDMFNSHEEGSTEPRKTDELMTLIATKQSEKIPRPTEELLKAARKNKLHQNDPTDIDLQSMMYLS